MTLEAARRAMTLDLPGVLAQMTAIMSIPHHFQEREARPVGLRPRYILEIGADQLAVYSDRAGGLLVQPAAPADFQDAGISPIPVLRLTGLADRIADPLPAYV